MLGLLDNILLVPSIGVDSSSHVCISITGECGGRDAQLPYLDWDMDRLLTHLHVDPEQGLDSTEASKRFLQGGPNRLKTAPRPALWQQFLVQFKDIMVLILLVATGLSLWLGEIIDSIAIVAIILVNAILGMVQEAKAERSLQALQSLSSPVTTVVRHGGKTRIPAEELVIGDIVFLSYGDRVPADLRLLKTSSLMIEESSLTGESDPVSKGDGVLPTQTPLADRSTVAHMGTMVVRGSGRGVVVATGMDTEMGKIARLIETTGSVSTPLQKRLVQLGRVLVVLAVFLTMIVVLAGVAHGYNASYMLLSGISLAVAAIPEGLPAIVTIALALGVQRMIRRHAIVRKLPAVETLGCATVIGSDKTGTLTENKMVVTHLWMERHLVQVTDTGLRDASRKMPDISLLERLVLVAENCNNACLLTSDKGTGDPTEVALLAWARQMRRHYSLSKHPVHRLQERAFDSERKRMSVEVQLIENGQNCWCTKGAPETVLPLCTHIVQEGRTVSLSPSVQGYLLAKSQNLAGRALRVLALADRMERGEGEEGLVFLGFVGMMDPPRKDVAQVFRICQASGIRTIMITGDHRATAEAIATQLNMRRIDSKTLTGEEMDRFDDTELCKQVEITDVYARVTPEHKLRIVRSLQANGHVVAMTGDGVNDAPAIKAADIGVAMGEGGTDVAKEASSLVLADNRFSTIVAAIEEGRNIYESIQKFVCYLLASNVGEILLMLLAMMSGFPTPLVPIQILWVNLVTDGLPALALGVDPAESNVMKNPPRDAKESIFSRGVGWKIGTRGILIGLCSLLPFLLSLRENPIDLERAQTIAFTTLVLAQLVFVFDCRSTGTIFQRKPWDNVWLLLAVASSAFLLWIVVYSSWLQPIFHTIMLTKREWVLVGVMACLPVVLAGLLDRWRMVGLGLLRKTVRGSSSA